MVITAASVAYLNHPVELTAHRTGFVVLSHKTTRYCWPTLK